MRKIIAVVMMCLSCVLWNSGSLAQGRAFYVSQRSAVTLEVSSEKLNRINVAPWSIRNLWSDGVGFNAVLSEMSQDIFILPLVPAGTELQMTLEMMGGQMLDIALQVIAAKRGKILLLKEYLKREGQDEVVEKY